VDGGKPAAFSLHLEQGQKGTCETVVYFEDDDLGARPSGWRRRVLPSTPSLRTSPGCGGVPRDPPGA